MKPERASTSVSTLAQARRAGNGPESPGKNKLHTRRCIADFSHSAHEVLEGPLHLLYFRACHPFKVGIGCTQIRTRKLRGCCRSQRGYN